MLNERVDKLLEQKDWQEFDKSYIDIETIDGFVSFVKTEALNPQRIPSFIIEKKQGSGEWAPLINPESVSSTKISVPWRYIGVETDYSENGRGIITPPMITGALMQAKSL